ncbi:MAG: nickel pincer cofactor biosynthesis protein LarC [Spirochaetota bacterium]|nr:nickel pincer cofactor biosynthesis protein LarC [Spirochaetota bacterium]
MSILYFDAFSGVSGDMIIGSLIHLGVDFNILKNELKKLPLEGYELKCETKIVSGIESIKFDVICKPESKHRHLKDIKEIITQSNINPFVKDKSLDIFNTIAIAEAKIHGTTKDKVHFHEVGAIDSIIDIVGSCIALHTLGVTEIISSPLPFGRGFIKCSHGNMPLPAPATLEILKDFPSYGVNIEGELVTPTGAAILKCWVTKVSNYPKMKITRIGYGSGNIQREIPNLLRVILADNIYDDTIKKELLFIETNIDDLNPEVIPHVCEKLYNAGILDFYTTPICMKKGRNGIKLSILLEKHMETSVLEILYRETTTLGVRKSFIDREELNRREILFDSSFGKIRIKESFLNGEKINFKPEYDDLKKVSNETNIPLKEVYLKVLAEYTIKAI